MAEMRSKGHITVATVNVRTLAGKLDLLLQELKHVDVLCLQETRVSRDMAPGIIAKCARLGYQCVVGQSQTSKTDHVFGTNAVISKWPIAAVRGPAGPHFHRAQFFAIHDSQGGPIVVANIHGPYTMDNQFKFMRKVSSHLASFGRRSFVDW